MTDCVFCRIVRREIPAAVVYSEPGVLAFRDAAPQAPVHVIVVPTEHVSSLSTAGEKLSPLHLEALLSAAACVAELEGIAEMGYRTVINTGPHAGQSVGHLHLHVLGGRAMGSML